MTLRENAGLVLVSRAERHWHPVVSKSSMSLTERLKDSPYRSGTRSGWIKVKTPEWKAANPYRAKLFEKPARG